MFSSTRVLNVYAQTPRRHQVTLFYSCYLYIFQTFAQFILNSSLINIITTIFCIIYVRYGCTQEQGDIIYVMLKNINQISLFLFLYGVRVKDWFIFTIQRDIGEVFCILRFSKRLKNYAIIFNFFRDIQIEVHPNLNCTLIGMVYKQTSDFNIHLAFFFVRRRSYVIDETIFLIR